MLYENPILGNYKSRMIYAGVWLTVAVVQTTTVFFSTADLYFGYALADSFIFNFILACVIIPLWYPVRFNTLENKTMRVFLTAHFLLACTIIALWLFAGYLLCYLIGAGDDSYLQFLKISLRWKALEGLLFYIIGVLLYYLFIHIEQLNEKASNEIRLNKLVRDGELNLLKSQINPHFLFNSMNSVNSLILHDPEQAQKMLIAMADYLRYAVVASNRAFSSLSEEMENIERYLSIEKMRFSDKLVYQNDIEPTCLCAELPAMLLQPLFENAIKHGVYESLESISVLAKTTKEGQHLKIEISNGFDDDGLSQRKGAGTGLRNIGERLRLIYGTSATMLVKAEQGTFTVTLKIPYIIIEK